ncbi:cytochrome c oxidase assembly protein [Geodermatophilus aquaeductus]|uniref:Putative copper resistance protein D n=1 Tax=Geodermatophilus aquaeductus TaxID=1564161 RepID=A0A521FJJ4_9ACTN|nr:cytochrome c oxidase assembly protein [Geodermatophilus aquaeductus]SMO96296.1 putative copper resistance protein D [Geodermatophilus aquaeductus]
MMWMPEQPPTLLRLLTPQLDATSVFPAVALLTLAAYLAGVRSLHARRRQWPWYRTASFVTGIATVLLVTATQVMGYGMMLFSVHMLQKLVLSVLSAMLIMLGAPISLAVRTLPRRGLGAACRRLLLGLLRSRTAKVVAHPAVTTTIFIGSLYGIYFTPLFDVLMRSAAGNVAMLTLFLGTGLLAFGGALGVGPWPHRASPPVRLIELMAPGPLHAFFAVAVMMASRPLVQTFTHAPQGWGVDVMTDQLAAGNIVWGFGEVPTVAAAVIIYAQWVSATRRTAGVTDARADAELDAYNAHLERLAAQATNRR